MSEANQSNEIKTLLMAVSRIEQKVDNLGNVREIAIQVQESVKSAHNRIDDIKAEAARDLDKLKTELKTDYDKKITDLKTDTVKTTDKQEGHITWLWRAIIGAIITGTIGGVIGILFFMIKANGGA